MSQFNLGSGCVLAKAINKNIKQITKQIKENFNPDKIILIGSHAYGNPDENSDVDLLVIMNYKVYARPVYYKFYN